MAGAAARWTVPLRSASSRRFATSVNTENLYELLGVPHNSSPAVIKAAFYARAKELHPDAQQGPVHTTHAFVQLAAAYEVLGDPSRRAAYDATLGVRSDLLRSALESDSWQEESPEDQQVAEWLRSYRISINALVRSGDVSKPLQRDFTAALRLAYHGPKIPPLGWGELPNVFEAEERTVSGVGDVLQVVSGRTLLATVREHERSLLEESKQKVQEIAGGDLSAESSSERSSDDVRNSDEIPEENAENNSVHRGVHLEMFQGGRLVGWATKHKAWRPGRYNEEISEECISVYAVDENADIRGRLLGRIFGFKTDSFGLGAASVFAVHSEKATHTLLQHRTPGVRHMVWYRHEFDAQKCEARCRRAVLPPSWLWLFQPRSRAHDCGGWYFERFTETHRLAIPAPEPGRMSALHSWNKRTIAYMCNNAQSYGREDSFRHEKRALDPRVYVLVAAYNTIEEESIIQRKRHARSLTNWLYQSWWKWRI